MGRRHENVSIYLFYTSKKKVYAGDKENEQLEKMSNGLCFRKLLRKSLNAFVCRNNSCLNIKNKIETKKRN